MSNHGTKIGMGRTQLANEDMLFFVPHHCKRLSENECRIVKKGMPDGLLDIEGYKK